MKPFRFHFGPPQQLAALLLLIFLAECLWVVHRQQLSPADYRFARCGREMWERPSPLAGYFTTCGNLQGDGTFAYRVAGLPLTLQRLTLLATDKLRKPENRLYVNGSLNGSTWEARHEIGEVKYLLHVPFILFALWLGAGLWWVSRRLFGNEGAFLSLGLYCFCPAVIRYAVVPNDDVLAMWGMYGLVYTAIGVAHAMHGPRSRWRPRILLLTTALGLTATAHLLAAIVGFAAAAVLMFYLAVRRRGYVLEILTFAAVGGTLVVFASYAFHSAAFSYVFTGGAARFSVAFRAADALFLDVSDGPIVVATLVSVVLWMAVRRSRYFGNSVPFAMAVILLPLVTTQTFTTPWLWAIPFLLTFVGGVFADALEIRQRRLFLALMGGILVTQALACLLVLPRIARL